MFSPTRELPDLLEWGFEESELQLDWGNDAAPDPGAQVDKAAELQEKWQVERGQIWQVGRHRVMCGDSTSEEDVGRLMGGVVAAGVVTSPPYWVGMEYETQISQEEIVAFIDSIVDTIVPLVRKNESRIIINTGTGRASAIEEGSPPETWLLLDWWRDALLRFGWRLRHIRLWIKRGGFAAPRGTESDIIDQHWEFIGTFYHPDGRKRGQNRVRESWAQSGYWDDFVGEARQSGHVASFPVELPLRCLRLYGLGGEEILEPFLGSGTTLVACEQTNRIGYGMEIETKYVAVTLERLSQMGLEARLIED